MSPNRHAPHVYVIPEDRANEQLAIGFVNHDQVKPRQIQIMPPADGWPSVLQKFTNDYIRVLRNNQFCFVILLIDFDAQYDRRRAYFEDAIPTDLKDRVFVIGAKENPEILKQTLGIAFEEIGQSLAEDCYHGTTRRWGHDHLKHNNPDRLRLVNLVRPILF